MDEKTGKMSAQPNGSYDVAIIGGGITGCALARELSRYRLRIVVLERLAEVGFGTTKTNSGIVHAGHHTGRDTLKGRLEARGNRLIAAMAPKLGFGFRRCGEIVVAQNEQELALLEHLRDQGTAKGVPGLAIWDRDKLRREEPNLSHHLAGALEAPSAGVINPYEFAFALMECARNNGVELFVDSPVTGIVAREACIELSLPSGRIASRFVLNCAGLAADQVAAMIGPPGFSIHPRKGEEYMLDRRLEGIVRRLIFPVPARTSKGILIIPTFDGTIMVGPTAHETDDRHDVATTNEGTRTVFDAVRRMCPSIHPRDTIAEFAGLRAVANTNDFVIGPSTTPGFINVAGIQSPGLTASPAIAEYVASILGEEGLPLVERDDWRESVEHPPRFAQQTPERQRWLTRRNPRFARMVCRCETVTEAEIHHAVDHGARTLDGVKFRTRAGMGRCQGGFCTCRIMEILARRAGIPMHAVTKKGGRSWIVTPMDGAHACSNGEDRS